VKFEPDTKDAVLFIFGCAGMLVFGLLLPAMGEGFTPTLFGSWALVAGVGAFGDRSRRAEDRNT
jgi:hypothetical protein